MESRRPSATEILNQLPKSNCRECGVNTCMAFAALVVKRQMKLTQCPYIDVTIADDLNPRINEDTPSWQDPESALLEVKHKIRDLDFDEAANRLGLRIVDDRLRVHVLGRIFDVDKNGDLHTICHVNYWLHGPILNYLLKGQGVDVCGEWMPFSGLENIEDMAPFFAHRAERAFQKLADQNTELFITILETFGKPVDNGLVDADVSIRLLPLPKLPFLYSYWKPEGEFPSKLAIHFDRTATKNADARTIFFLAVGLSEMFTRFIESHFGTR